MTTPRKPDFIFFDLGDTLIKPRFDRPTWLKNWRERAIGKEKITVEMIRSEADALIKQTQKIRREYNLEFGRSQFHRNMMARMGVVHTLSEEEIDRIFVDVSFNEVPEPGVKNVLGKAQSLGIRAGVISNSVLFGKTLEYVLERNDMMKYFEFVMSTTDYGFLKPHLQLFVTALKKAKVEPERAWHIGDKLKTDVIGAKNAGITAIWYNPDKKPKGEIEPDYEIGHWDEFMECESLQTPSSASVFAIRERKLADAGVCKCVRYT